MGFTKGPDSVQALLTDNLSPGPRKSSVPRKDSKTSAQISPPETNGKKSIKDNKDDKYPSVPSDIDVLQ